jgi:hypothetical protein
MSAQGVSEITIEEIDLEGGGTPRMVVLRGGGLPKESAKWAGKQRVKTRFAIGSAVGTQHVLGPIEVPSSWGGEWHRGMLWALPCTVKDEGGERKVIQPLKLMEALEAIFRGGAKLRVTWHTRIDIGQEDKNIVREGRCTSWEFDILRAEDVNWQFEFEWVSRAENPPDLYFAKDIIPSMEALLQEADTALDLYINKNKVRIAQGGKTPARINVFQAFSQFVGSIQRATGTLNRAMRKLNDGLDRLLAFRSQILNIPATGIAAAQDFIGLHTRAKYEFTRMPPEVSVARLRATDALKGAASFFQQGTAHDAVTNAALKVMTAGTRFQVTDGKLAPRTDPRAKSFYKTVEGDTPITVSTKMYGGPARAVDILRANRLPLTTTAFEPGTLLVIPRP